MWPAIGGQQASSVEVMVEVHADDVEVQAARDRVEMRMVERMLRLDIFA